MRYSVQLSSAFLALFLTLSGSPACGQDSTSFTMRFAGDCLLAGYYETAAGNDPAMAFSEFDLLRTADLAMVNLECPITTRGVKVEKPYNFRMHPSYISALTAGGIDVVNLANNHIFDYGPEGLFDTISYLDSAGIKHVGAGKDLNQARTPVVLEGAGRRIGLVGYYGGGEAPGATDTSAGVARRDVAVIAHDISWLRERDSVSCVIVTLHWGTEKADTPEVSQIRFAHAVIDAGADVVIGHHPHVLQGIERYKSGVIAYSLGNFIFGGNSRSTYSTGVLEVRLEGDSVCYAFLPVGIRGWKASALSGSEADAVLDHVKRVSSVFRRSLFTN